MSRTIIGNIIDLRYVKELMKSDKLDSYDINLKTLNGKTYDSYLLKTYFNIMLSAGISNNLLLINKPSTIHPDNHDVDVSTKNIELSDYSTSVYYNGPKQATHYQLSIYPDFRIFVIDGISFDSSNFINNLPLKNITKYYFRFRYISDNHVSEWSDTIEFTTGELITIETPSITINGYPNNISIAPVLNASDLNINTNNYSNVSAIWSIYDTFGNLVYDITKNINITSLEVPLGALTDNETYTFTLRYIVDSNESELGTIEATVSADIIIDTPNILVLGAPSNVSKSPTINGSQFNLLKGEDIHRSTTWSIIDNENENTLWESIRDSNNLYSIKVPDGILNAGNTYFIYVQYHGNFVDSPISSINITVDEYALSNSITNAALLPMPLYGHQQTTLSNGDILITGGMTVNNAISNKCYIYRIRTNEYIEVSSMPFRLAHHGQSLVNGNIIVIGGMTDSILSNTVLMYLVGDDKWILYDQLPFYIKDHGQSTLLDNTILITGGTNLTVNYHKVYIYSYTYKLLIEKNDLPINIKDHAQLTLENGNVLISGGINDTYLNSNYLYYPNMDLWIENNALPSQISKHSMTMINNGTVILIGGSNGSGLVEIYSYNPINRSWTYVTDLNNNLCDHSSSHLNNGILITGGITNSILSNTSNIYS